MEKTTALSGENGCAATLVRPGAMGPEARMMRDCCAENGSQSWMSGCSCFWDPPPNPPPPPEPFSRPVGATVGWLLCASRRAADLEDPAEPVSLDLPDCLGGTAPI